MDTSSTHEIKTCWWDFLVGVGIIIYYGSQIGVDIIKQKPQKLWRSLRP